MQVKFIAMVGIAMSVSCSAFAQGSAGGTAGSTNAAVSGQSAGANSAPTQPGITPGSSNPAGTNGELGNPGFQHPNTGVAPQTPGVNSAGTANATGRTAAGGANIANRGRPPAGVGVGGPNTHDPPDTIDRENRELDKKLNNICRGC
jgi:hypothetical protein